VWLIFLRSGGFFCLSQFRTKLLRLFRLQKNSKLEFRSLREQPELFCLFRRSLRPHRYHRLRLNGAMVALG
jgi:hypothetical protein